MRPAQALAIRTALRPVHRHIPRIIRTTTQGQLAAPVQEARAVPTTGSGPGETWATRARPSCTTRTARTRTRTWCKSTAVVVRLESARDPKIVMVLFADASRLDTLVSARSGLGVCTPCSWPNRRRWLRKARGLRRRHVERCFVINLGLGNGKNE